MLRTVKLGDVAWPISRPVTVVPGENYRTLGVKWWGEGAYERATIDGSQTAAKTLSLVREDDLIINKIWVRHGSVAVASGSVDGCAASGEFPTFELDPSVVLPRWIHWLTKTQQFWNECDRLSRGTSGKNRIRPELFLTITIPLPSLDEQRWIVGRIEAVAGRVEEARRLLDANKALATALQRSILNRVFAGLKISGTLGDVLTGKPRNGWSARCDNQESGIPVLTLSAITGFEYQRFAFKRTSEPTSADAHYWLEPGDLLITRSNTPQLVGHAALYDGNPYPCIYSDLMMRVPVNPALTDPSFVHLWLQCSAVREYVMRNAIGTSPSMKKISQGVVMGIPFPVGVSLDTQRQALNRFEECISMLKHLDEWQASIEIETAAVLPSLIQAAFWGKL